MAEQAKKGKKRTSFLTMLVIAILIVYATPVFAEISLTFLRIPCQSGTLPLKSSWIFVPRNGSCVSCNSASFAALPIGNTVKMRQ